MSHFGSLYSYLVQYSYSLSDPVSVSLSVASRSSVEMDPWIEDRDHFSIEATVDLSCNVLKGNCIVSPKTSIILSGTST